MAALAESLVDEWLNRKGFFTVRGTKHGVDEIDLLGVRPSSDGLEAWYVEVQASFRPIGYIAPIPRESVEGFAKSKTSAKQRPRDLIQTAVSQWVTKKFNSPSKRSARESAWPGLSWGFVFVHAVVRDEEELHFIANHDIQVVPLHLVLPELEHSAALGVRGGAGTDLSEIIACFYKHGGRAKNET